MLISSEVKRKVNDGGGDQTQGSKEAVNWKEPLALQNNSVKNIWKREA